MRFALAKRARIDWWLGLPRWIRVGISALVLACPTYYLLTTGVIFCGAFVLGGCLLVGSFPRAMGPQRSTWDSDNSERET